jgi:hypothetical protein
MRHGQTEPGPPSIVSTVKINQSWSRMSEQKFRLDKWSACRG